MCRWMWFTPLLWGLTAAAAEIYVAKDGDDGAPGTLKRPFATLVRARDEARKWNTKGPVTVYVRAGVYDLPETLKLEAQDSRVTWRPYRNEKVTLTAAQTVTGFTPWKAGILKAQAGALHSRQLFYRGRRQHLARYPNYDPQNPYAGGWAYADGKPVPMYQEIPGETRNSFTYKPEDARPWAHPQDGEVFVFPRYNWWNNIVRIQSIDREKRLITLAGNCSYPIRPGDRYYVRGLLEELDAPGEWHWDSRSGTLYFWPPDGAKNPAVQLPRFRNIIEIGKGATEITIRGFTLEYFDGSAIQLTGAVRCLIAGNTIRNGGDYTGSAVAVNEGRDNLVSGNDIYEVGSHAISISGGDRITLTPANNVADNNYIHHTGVYYKQGVGISLRGCGNRASHNRIHHTPRFAIQFSGNNLVIEYNHLHHMNLETADTGAVYTGGRDWLGSRGTVLRYNYMHDSLGFGFENGRWVTPHYSWGIYLDDNTGGVDVIGNIVVRAYRGLIHLHNGRDNLIENNIFVDGKLQQAEFNGWTDQHRYWKTHLPTMIAGYNSVKDQPAWKNMRNMHIAPELAVLPGGLIMSGNVFQRNIVYYADPSAKLFGSRNLSLEHNWWDYNLYWGGGHSLRIARGGNLGEWDFQAWQRAGQDLHSLVADPLFADAAKDDYRLKPNSPAFKLGFKPIPVEKIGPYPHEYRASWPIAVPEAGSGAASGKARGVREQ